MITSSAVSHRLFVQLSITRPNLSRIQDFNVCTRDSLNKSPCRCRNPTHPSKKLKRHPFTSQNTPGISLYLHHSITSNYQIAIFLIHFEDNLWIHSFKNQSRYSKPRN